MDWHSSYQKIPRVSQGAGTRNKLKTARWIHDIMVIHPPGCSADQSLMGKGFSHKLSAVLLWTPQLDYPCSSLPSSSRTFSRVSG